MMETTISFLLLKVWLTGNQFKPVLVETVKNYLALKLELYIGQQDGI